ncbi:MAG: hypothetical protein HY936_11060 [Nitrosomonadales bacterium]|nr:hypothetical protein [Nitrosomonadales bacterium]
MHNLKFSVSAGWVFSVLLSAASGVYARNSITALNAGYIGNGTTVIKVGLAHPPASLPDTEFIIGASPRIVLEFHDTVSELGESALDFTEVGLRSANIVRADGRTRFVIYLNQSVPYNIRIDGSSLLIILRGNAADADASMHALRLVEAKQDVQKHTLNSGADDREQIWGETQEKLSRDDARPKAKKNVPVAAEKNARPVMEAGAAKVEAIAAYTAQPEDGLFAPDRDILIIRQARSDTGWLFPYLPNANFALSLSSDTASVMPGLRGIPQKLIVGNPKKGAVWPTNARWQIASDGPLFSPILRFESKEERLDIKPRRRSIWIGWGEAFP